MKGKSLAEVEKEQTGSGNSEELARIAANKVLGQSKCDHSPHALSNWNA